MSWSFARGWLIGVALGLVFWAAFIWLLGRVFG